MKAALSKAKKLARSLLKANRLGRSWRVIAREDYRDRVNFVTLNRIARTKGEWLPKDCEVLAVLGLLKQRSPYSGLPRWYKRTPEALQYFQRKKEQVKQLSTETREEAKKGRQS